MSETWALITGLVRDISALREKVSQLCVYKSAGKLHGIVFSTWVNEIEKYEGLRAFLLISGVKIVESREPGISVSAHLFHQNKSLALGLDAIPKSAFVYKLRTDLSLVNDRIMRTISKQDNLEVTPLPGWPKLFSKRILVQGGLLTQPLFLNDIAFAGVNEDIHHLAGHSFVFEAYGLFLNPEQMIFGTPFIGFLPMFFEWFRVNFGLIHGKREYAKEVLNFALEEQFYLDCLALYFLILSQYFRIGMHERDSKEQQIAAQAITKLSYSQFFLSTDETCPPNFSFHEGSNSISFGSDYWLDAVLNGKLVVDELGKRFLESVERVKDLSWQERFSYSGLQLSKEAYSFGIRLKERFPQTNYRLTDIGPDKDGNWRIEGRPPSVRLTGDALKALKDE